MKKIHVKPKKLSLEPKYPLFGYIKARISKIIVIFEISTLEFFIFQSCVQTKKFLNLGPKMPFSAVWSIIFEKPLSYLKSAPSTLSNCKILYKNKYAGDQKHFIWTFLGWKFKNLFSWVKISKFRTKFALFGCFGHQF